MCLYKFQTCVDHHFTIFRFYLSLYLILNFIFIPRCVIHATILNTRAEAYSDMLEGDCVAEMALHNPQLGKFACIVVSYCFYYYCYLNINCHL